MAGVIGWLMGKPRVLRGDELMRRGGVSTSWVCRDHGAIVPVMVQDEWGNAYEACRMCLYASPDIQEIEDLAEEIDDPICCD